MPPVYNKDEKKPAGLLKVKQRAWVNEMLTGECTAIEACIRVGYSADCAKTQASRLLHNPAVMAELRREMSVACERAGVTPQWVVQALKSNMDACKQEGDRSAYNVAAKALGEAVGLLGKSRLEVSGPNGGAVVIDNESDKRLLESLMSKVMHKVDTP